MNTENRNIVHEIKCTTHEGAGDFNGITFISDQALRNEYSSLDADGSTAGSSSQLCTLKKRKATTIAVSLEIANLTFCRNCRHCMYQKIVDGRCRDDEEEIPATHYTNETAPR
eukprot:gnl/MRDRNA2_/MRDRNA2_155433_c0_seq1.p1 gnl/MRDRNA2_/MRDRNA2_155433_c0~~gnl/MRDRNA2_/MRDRNA2_155433_c0_seq1.p1  ORF type:complete len:113 (-),score=15.41 gnl/MRDRNA2_/MRDRNA2_155433_c0_seq1:29-367(-)